MIEQFFFLVWKIHEMNDAFYGNLNYDTNKMDQLVCF